MPGALKSFRLLKSFDWVDSQIIGRGAPSSSGVPRPLPSCLRPEGIPVISMKLAAWIVALSAVTNVAIAKYAHTKAG